MFGFWLFCTVTVLLTPGTMLLLGRRFLARPPREINGVFGYRTSRSMRNAETWAFAHACCGKLWIRLGAVMLPLSVLAMLPSLGQGAGTVGLWCGAVALVQIAMLIGSIVPVERALKQRFETGGHRNAP